jgi:adenosylmethionine-8-amino-7-oxononanoate aminotransferase
VRAGEAVLAAALDSVAGTPGVAEVRHAGLLGTIELAPELLADRPTAADEVAAAARANGVLTRVLRGVAFQLSPAFVSTDDELRAMVARLADAIAVVQ